MKPNTDIHNIIRVAGFRNWQVANKMNIHENTFCRLLRKELTEGDRKRIFQALAELKADREKELAQIG